MENGEYEEQEEAYFDEETQEWVEPERDEDEDDVIQRPIEESRVNISG
jgi:hypothetical protein